MLLVNKGESVRNIFKAIKTVQDRRKNVMNLFICIQNVIIYQYCAAKYIITHISN